MPDPLFQIVDRHADGRELLSITADGQLQVAGEPVALSPGQQAALLVLQQNFETRARNVGAPYVHEAA